MDRAVRHRRIPMPPGVHAGLSFLLVKPAGVSSLAAACRGAHHSDQQGSSRHSRRRSAKRCRSCSRRTDSMPCKCRSSASALASAAWEWARRWQAPEVRRVAAAAVEMEHWAHHQGRTMRPAGRCKGRRLCCFRSCTSTSSCCRAPQRRPRSRSGCCSTASGCREVYANSLLSQVSSPAGYHLLSSVGT